MTRRVRKRLLASAGLGLLSGALLAALHLLGFFSTGEVRMTDLLFKSRAPETARSTVIVGIDQRSYRALLPRHGPMATWPRALHARALDALREAGARVVALDIFFDAPRPEDGELAAAMKRAGNVIAPVEAQGPRALDARPGVAQEFDVFVRPTPAIAAAAAAEGFVNVTTDRDTVVRGLPLLLRAGGEDVPALALTIVARFVRRPAVIDRPPADGWVHAAGRAIPLGETGSMPINFLGPPSSPERGGSFRIIPLIDVLDGTFDRAFVRDRIVLIGLTIRGVDEHSTASTSVTRMWGVEVLANAVETILGERYLRPLAPAVTVGLTVLLAVGTALLVAASRPVVAAVAVLLGLGLYALIASVLFDGGTVLNLVYPPGALLLGFAVVLVYQVVFEQREQRVIRGVIARYLSPSVSEWVLRDPERLRLGGETRDMTVLFCDLRDFTGLSRALDPQALVALLNEHMTAMTEVVFRHDGVLDKYVGDAIVAFWNAPMAQPDHARHACLTALDMIETLHTLHADWERRGVPKLELGIGINTGPMVVGNMGSRERLAYTVLGDTVNVASRLEGQSKEYRTRVVIGEATRAAAGDDLEYRFLDVVAVKGRREPLRVYEVVGRAGRVDPGLAAILPRWEPGIALYRERRWSEAAAFFGELHAEAPGDGPTALYLRRSREFLATPPPADWDGVYVATNK
ncbi:MAG: adenylate/guanylate cyclase domain-containing protein [Candidatus Rokubacteria bacterium]|nr:adenylate/guanylate cyclase domain-containing protein [Candidatus Rokubacteria bacterium]